MWTTSASAFRLPVPLLRSQALRGGIGPRGYTRESALRKLSTGVALAGLAIPLFLIGSTASAAGSCTPGSIRDFNGDTLDDIAIGDPEATVGGQEGAGYVVIQDGSLGIGEQFTLTQSNAGVGETSQSGDQFGAMVATGFIDGDGCADLIVSAPGEDLALTSTAGVVSVVFGSPDGLGKGRPGFTLSQGSGIMPGNRGAGDRFGTALATGPQLHQWLFIGAPADNVGSKGDTGTVTSVRFDASGNPIAAHLISQDTAGLEGAAVVGDRFGAALAVLADACLVVGVPGEDIGSYANAGQVQTVCNIPAGGSYSDDVLTQNSTGVSDSVEAGDGFGSSVVVHIGNSEVAKLGVGVPREDVGSITDAGVVHWLNRMGSPARWVDGFLVSQNSTGVSDSAESGDRFGTKLYAAVIGTPQGLRDLIMIGSPYENVGSAADAGIVQVLDATGRSEFTLSQSSSGVAGSPASGDHFGAAINTIGWPASLLIGAPDDTGYSRGVVHGIRWNRLFTGTGLTYTLTPGPNGRRFGASIDSA